MKGVLPIETVRVLKNALSLTLSLKGEGTVRSVWILWSQLDIVVSG